jgi:hypothetical protein
MVVPSPLPPQFLPISQNNKNNFYLYLYDIALILSPPQVVIASTPSNSVFKFQHVIVQASDGSNIHKVFMFVKNESIQYVGK